jgi:AraC-like DNA-binding protein
MYSGCVLRALRHIASSRDRVTVAQLAVVAGCSRSTLKKRFKAELGTSVHKYEMCVLFRRAAAVLEDGGSVKEAIDVAGLKNRTNFNRQFSRLYVAPPCGIPEAAVHHRAPREKRGG